MTFKKNLITAIATGAVLLNALAPLAFADTITVTGNGEASTSNVTVASTNSTNVTQSNTTNVTNNVNSSANTGGNTAYSNTGGSVLVGSGAASSSTAISNEAGLNSASVSCGCNNTATNVNVAGNGEFSHNTVTATNANSTSLNQTNNTNFTNNVNNSANSGNNTVAGNTGSYLGGSTFGVVAGSATSDVSIVNRAGANFANVGSGSGTGNGSSVSIVGNGENSTNSVVLGGSSRVSLDQSNNTNITNNVNNSANSGGNVAFSNTGGSVYVGSGAADAMTDILNEAGFNQASVDCGCLTSGLSVLLGGNGEFSHNTVRVTPSNTLGVSQGNGANLYNNANSNATSGNSVAAGNTGSVNGGSTTQVFSGSADQDTSISNKGGLNTFGNGSFTLPTWLTGGSHVSTTFDFTAILAMWTGMFHV